LVARLPKEERGFEKKREGWRSGNGWIRLGEKEGVRCAHGLKKKKKKKVKRGAASPQLCDGVGGREKKIRVVRKGTREIVKKRERFLLQPQTFSVRIGGEKKKGGKCLFVKRREKKKKIARIGQGVQRKDTRNLPSFKKGQAPAEGGEGGGKGRRLKLFQQEEEPIGRCFPRGRECNREMRRGGKRRPFSPLGEKKRGGRGGKTRGLSKKKGKNVKDKINKGAINPGEEKEKEEARGSALGGGRTTLGGEKGGGETRSKRKKKKKKKKTSPASLNTGTGKT